MALVMMMVPMPMDVNLLLLLRLHLLHRRRSMDDLWLLRLFHPLLHTLNPYRWLLGRSINLLHNHLRHLLLLWRRLLLGRRLRANRTNNRLGNLLRGITNRQHFLVRRRRRLRNQLPRLRLLLLLGGWRRRSRNDPPRRGLQLYRRFLLLHRHRFRLRLNLLRLLLGHNSFRCVRFPFHHHHSRPHRPQPLRG